jgi:uncharacterized membrane protein YcaP (DUF421 family)
VIFDSLHDLVRVGIVSTLIYAWVVLLLRISGKRTLAKMNAFDLVVTVALGSTLATVALSKDVSFTEGAVALLALCGAQFVVAWASTRSPVVSRAVKARPVLVVADGNILRDVLQRERLTEGEVLQAARRAGAGTLEQVGAMVLETDGELSVVLRSDLGRADTLEGVVGARRRNLAREP